jgi:hypothetical protein
MKRYVVGHDESTIYVQTPPRRTRTVLSAVAAGGVAVAYLGAPYIDFKAIKHDITTASVSPVAHVSKQAAPRQAAPGQAAASETHYIDEALLYSKRPLGFAPKVFAQQTEPPPRGMRLYARASAPQQVAAVAAPEPHAPVVHTVHSVPLPMPRPAELASLNNQKPALQTAVLRKPTPVDPFEKLFGKRTLPSSALGYASADGGVRLDGSSTSSGAQPQNDRTTAIYDITAKVVHMPDGSKLEAHSGLGEKMDDPRHVDVRMHGATPPHVYDLAPREALFHGDEALRMYPVGGSEAIFGRTGLLTHSYLLGPNGQSNGCISFKDYLAFLRAYKDGKVKRIVVVASIDNPQMDLRLLGREPVVAASQNFPSSRGRTVAASYSRPNDDRYLPEVSSARASRTN